MKRVLLILLLCTLGCSKGPPKGPNLATTYPVSGQIRFGNGTKLIGGIIYFTPLEVKSGWQVRYEGAGLIDNQGRFKVGFGGNTAGVATGEYKVTIQPREYQELRSSNSGQIPKPYREKDTTPLTVTVEEKENTFDFVLR